MTKSRKSVSVGIIMGSESDWSVMHEAAKVLREFGVTYETRVVSAHRTPTKMMVYAQDAEMQGIKVIIAGAGGAAHLPGMTASFTTLPVIGVPVTTRALKGLDSLLSIAQMPAGVPVATMSIGEAGAKNAGLFAVRMLANSDPGLRIKLRKFQKKNQARVEQMDRKITSKGKKL